MRLIIIILMLAIAGCTTYRWMTSDTGLKYRVIKNGNGVPAVPGNEVLIHETMRYANDSLLFDSRTLPSAVKVKIGANQAIAGIDEGLRGMKTGEVRKLIVPPHLSRRSGNPTFPHPDSTLIYEVELVKILH